MKLSAIIPCHNEEKVVNETNRIMLNILDNLVKCQKISKYELIYIDDGSRDNTLHILESIASHNSLVKVIAFSNNFGHQAALTAGINKAEGDVIVTLDADLQDPPEYISAMLEKIQMGYDIVYGVRKARDNDSYFKKNSARIYYKILNIFGVNVVYDHAEYRMFTKKVKLSFDTFHEAHRFIRGIFPLMGYKHCSIEYPRDPRLAGETKYSIYKMCSFAIEGITSFSYVPLRLAAVLGFIVFVFTLLLSLWALFMKFIGHTVPGWTSVVIPVYILGGIQMIFLGIFGEYLGKMYSETKKRPLYFIDKMINFEK